VDGRPEEVGVAFLVGGNVETVFIDNEHWLAELLRFPVSGFDSRL